MSNLTVRNQEKLREKRNILPWARCRRSDHNCSAGGFLLICVEELGLKLWSGSQDSKLRTHRASNGN